MADFFMDFATEKENTTRKVQIPEIKASTVTLAELAAGNPNGTVEISPGDLSEACREFERKLRDAVRLTEVES